MPEDVLVNVWILKVDRELARFVTAALLEIPHLEETTLMPIGGRPQLNYDALHMTSFTYFSFQ